VDRYPPAGRGSIIAAVEAGYHLIGVIDGLIEEDTCLTGSEILNAIRPGRIKILGGASMGAIRAAELESVGMRGVGHVFRLFRRRIVQDNDEVYVLHAPHELDYRSITIPLINVRLTLRALHRAGWLDPAEEAAIACLMKNVPWPERDLKSLHEAAAVVLDESQHESFIQRFRESYRDIKREDALLVLSTLQSERRLLNAARSFDPAEGLSR
jgi:hypothetical protein